MNCFVNCLKPPGMTSHDVVGFMRRLLNTKKIGHAGTLDPAAAGVLPIGVGKATKAMEFLDSDKKYRCEAILGLTTSTQDLCGQVIETKSCRGITESQVLDKLKSFLGPIEQVPPMYSAVKVKGKKLYQLARKGKTLAVPPRKVLVKEIKVLEIKRQAEFIVVMFDIACGKGTYIRTICHDLGQQLGCGGAMSFLLRTQAGPFSIQQAVTLDKLSDSAPNFSQYTVPIEEALDRLPAIVVDNGQVAKLTNGALVALAPEKLNSVGTKENMMIKVFSPQRQFLGIGEFKGQQNNFLKMKKILS